MSIGADDEMQIVSSRRVSLAAQSQCGLTADDAEGTRPGSERIDAALVATDGSILSTARTSVERDLRVEYPREDGEIVGNTVPAGDATFVLRLPASDAAFLDLRSSRTGRTTRLAVSELDRSARIRSEEEPAPLHPVLMEEQRGNPANRVDLLVIAEGYTARESDKFEQDAQRIIEGFLSVEPYATYRNYVNVSLLFVPSAQSGADHPSCGGTAPGTSAATVLDATFCMGGVERALGVSISKVYALAANYPDWDRIIVLVNDAEYGGSATGPISVVSTSSRVAEAMPHEFAHSFSGVADEYTVEGGGGSPCSDADPARRCEPNVTDQVDRAKIKWSAWISDKTPTPTPDGLSDVVGLFEGARFQTSGMYRSQYDCLMNRVSMSFCAVCAQTYVLRLYGGFGGNPARGIDLIEPGTESPSPGAVVNGVTGAPMKFAADVLRPRGGSVEVAWLLNGVPIAGANEPSLVFTPRAAGSYTVELQVKDRTAYVRPAAPPSLVKSRKWTLAVTDGAPKRRSVGQS